MTAADPATILTEAGIEVGVAVRTAEQSFARFLADDRPTEPETAAWAISDLHAALIAVCKLAAGQKRSHDAECDRCQSESAVRADKAEKELDELGTMVNNMALTLSKKEQRIGELQDQLTTLTARHVETVVGLKGELAALEAVVARLKCCGNCPYAILGTHSCKLEASVFLSAPDPCHFTPSRWTERT
jgi:hypothetical protein